STAASIPNQAKTWPPHAKPTHIPTLTGASLGPPIAASSTIAPPPTLRANPGPSAKNTSGGMSTTKNGLVTIYQTSPLIKPPTTSPLQMLSAWLPSPEQTHLSSSQMVVPGSTSPKA